ncbi:hypothetical protein KC909_01530 [Candidatus Dojkabacteria bacterium]|uniref:Ribulose-phosphate 3-epimerase n=1 Tax=Candidatus Dojkabacteria bacterium TaxID=2099670 RepID=A0A955RIR1_9BACT|nr:hypothetical protein [Candidatus Dojkabacteria bacterium]
MKIHPAILVKHLDDFLEQADAACRFTDEIDIDVIDWLRSPGKTVTAHDVISTTTNLKLNFDLMMDHPMDSIHVLVGDHRVNRIIVNVESKDDFKDAVRYIYNHDKKVGISFNPGSNPQEYKSLFKTLDMVQIMTIEPGRQGNKFDKKQLEVVHQVRGMGFEGLVGIDGGVNMDTIKQIEDYPIDIVSVGSAISKAERPDLVYKKLLKMLN